MKVILFCLLVPMTCSAATVDCPVEKTVAYSRQTTSGIPGSSTLAGSPDRPVAVSYFIYVVLKKGTVPSAAGLWLEGKFYDASLKRVDSPVVVAHDAVVPTGKKDTLVGKTSGDVYQIDPGAERTWKPGSDAEQKLTQGNQVVVFLKVGQATCYSSVREVKALPPAPGM
jgi:hypothetical protein